MVLFIVAMVWDYVSVELRPLTDPLSKPHTIHEWIWSSSGMILSGENRRTLREICASAILSTTDPTRTDLGPNLSLRNEKLAMAQLGITVLQ
jgi:hypothetical protein